MLYATTGKRRKYSKIRKKRRTGSPSRRRSVFPLPLPPPPYRLQLPLYPPLPPPPSTLFSVPTTSHRPNSLPSLPLPLPPLPNLQLPRLLLQRQLPKPLLDPRKRREEDWERWPLVSASLQSSTRWRRASWIGTSAPLPLPYHPNPLTPLFNRRFVDKEDLSDTLTHARKDGYLDKQDFLGRTEQAREDAWEKNKAGRRGR